MKWALLIGAIIEILGSFVVYFSADLMFITDTQTMVYRLYGLTMFVLGLLNVFIFKAKIDNKSFKQMYLTMMGFHAALSIMCHNAPDAQFPLYREASIAHGLLFALFIFFYMKDIKPE